MVSEAVPRERPDHLPLTPAQRAHVDRVEHWRDTGARDQALYRFGSGLSKRPA